MVPLSPEYMVEYALPKLIENSLSDFINTRHGSLYAIADILLGLNGKTELNNQSNYMKDSIFLRTLSKNE